MRRKQDYADQLGPRAGSRVLEILLEVAQTSGNRSLRQLTESLNMPRASLHRLLRSLEMSGFLDQNEQGYSLGPESYRLARLIGMSASPSDFPRSARPILEWLAKETQETVILGVLSDRRREIVYADVIVAESPLQYAVPSGDRRPLYSSATGKSVLAFMPAEERRRYIDETDFLPITPYTTTKDRIGDLLDSVRETGVLHERDSHFVGAGAFASPIFDSQGAVFAAVVVAGPNERLESNPAQIKDLVRTAGVRLSRTLGYEGDYPPQAGGSDDD